MSETPDTGFYEWWQQHYSMANLAMGAAEDAWNAATKAERERCGDVARNHIAVANSILNSGDSFSEAHWNGRLFAAEWIEAGIDASAIRTP